MADTATTGLTALTGAGVDAANDVIPIADVSATATKKITVAQLAAALSASGIVLVDSAWAAKGDLLAGTANDTAAILGVGANNTILEAASGQTTGLQWGTAPVKLATFTTAGDQIQATGSGAIARIAIGTAYQVQAVNSGATAVAYIDAYAIPQNANAQTGTTYTLALTDAGKRVTLSNASAITLTVDTNANVAFPVGTIIDLLQIGAGQVTVAAAGGVTINSTPTLKARAQHSGLQLWKQATNTWWLTGDLAAS